MRKGLHTRGKIAPPAEREYGVDGGGGDPVHHCRAAPGIWIDHSNQNSRVCRNLLHHVACTTGAIFFEASKFPNLIDHNLILNCDHAGVHMWKNQNRDRVGVKNNRIINNIIARCSVAFDNECGE